MPTTTAPASAPGTPPVAEPAKPEPQANAPAPEPKPNPAKAAAEATAKAIRDTFTPKPAPAPAPEPEKKAEPAPEPKPAETPPVKSSILSRKTAAPKPAEPAAAPEGDLPETKLELAGDASESSKKNFSALRKITHDLRGELSGKAKEIADLQAQLTAHRTAAPGDAAELQRLRDEHKALSERLAIVDLASHPDFARQYTQPKQQAIGEASEVLKYNGQDGVDMVALLAKPQKDFNAAVAQLTEKMNSMDATTVQTTLRTAYRIQASEREALSKAGDLSRQLGEKSAAQNRQAFDESWGNLGDSGQFLVELESAPDATAEDKQTVADYNKAVQGVRQSAERYAFGQTNPRQAAAIAQKAAILDFLTANGLPRMQVEFDRIVALNHQLASELAGLKKARSPNGEVAGAPSAKPAGNRGKTIDELVRETYHKTAT